MKESAFLGITERDHTGGGPGEGSYRVYRLMRSLDLAVAALDDR